MYDFKMKKNESFLNFIKNKKLRILEKVNTKAAYKIKDSVFNQHGI